MRHFGVERLALGLALASGGGCALGDGQPWGVVEIGVSVRFAPPSSRLDDDGRLKTANDYRVAIEEIVVVGRETRLPLLADASAAFDPGDPPEGYSLCHNGHCHADSGALVDYAAIAAELASSSRGAAIAVALAGDANVVATPTAFATEGCEGGCLAPPGLITTAVVSFAVVRVRGRAFDARTGDLARIDASGVAFELETPSAVSIAGELSEEERFGAGNRNDVLMNIDVLLSDRILDDLDFSSLSEIERIGGTEMADAISGSTLEISTSH
jgi:hypothetical protein